VSRPILDAYSLARLLYAAEQDPGRRELILAEGKRLAEAARFSRMHPGSLGQKRAAALALEALTALLALGWPDGEAA
jgi:hypothetical protein